MARLGRPTRRRPTVTAAVQALDMGHAMMDRTRVRRSPDTGWQKQA